MDQRVSPAFPHEMTQPRTKGMHPHSVIESLVSQGVPKAEAELAVFGASHPQPAPVQLELDFDSDTPLPTCALRNNGDDICESCQ